MARPEGLEPPAYWFEASRSIRLSYGRVVNIVSSTQGQMPVETEVKLPLRCTPEEARRIVERVGYRADARILEVDQLFDRPAPDPSAFGELRAAGQILRLRSAGSEWILTYKGPAARSPHKSREEIETSLTDGEAFATVLDRLGYRPSFRYEKYRTKFHAEGEPGLVTLDETPMGAFLELEGPSEWIDRTAPLLGFSVRDYVTLSYAALWRDYRLVNQSAPENMVFPGP